MKTITEILKTKPSFDMTILPFSRRKQYDIIEYILTKTPAKEGSGSFHISQFGKKFTIEYMISALEWMREIDGKENIDYSTTAGLHSLSLQKRDKSPYTIFDFQQKLQTFYL